MKQKFFNLKSDYIGILSAGLCLVHCILLPIFFAMRSINFEHEVEGGFKWDYVFLVLSFYAVYHSAKHSPSALIKKVLWGLFSILTACIFLESISEIFEYLIILASLGLVAVHFVNLRHCQRCATQAA
jgi:MerC mercury resistance protein